MNYSVTRSKPRIVRFNCPTCTSPLESPLEDAGQEYGCPTCAHILIVPGGRELSLQKREDAEQAAAALRMAQQKSATPLENPLPMPPDPPPRPKNKPVTQPPSSASHAGVLWIIALEIFVIVVFLAPAAFTYWASGRGSYKGVKVSEWKRLADDYDFETQNSAYRALAASGQTDFLISRFGIEHSTSAKLIIGNAIISERRREVRDFVVKVLSDRSADAYLRDKELADIIRSLAYLKDTTAIEEQLHRLEKESFDGEAARQLLDIIKEAQKP